jgi:hypothetical protein
MNLCRDYAEKFFVRIFYVEHKELALIVEPADASKASVIRHDALSV